MDPIMRAARTFLGEAEAWWRHNPGRLLPLVADPSERGEMVKALRLGERAPESRRPLFLCEAPFQETTGYFDGLTQAIERDYEAVREGVAEEGVTLPAYTLNAVALGPLERAALAMERAATLLGDGFEGAMVALVPEHVVDGVAFRQSVEALGVMGRSARVRLAVYAPPGGPLDGVLDPRGACFRVEPAELLQFLAEVGSPTQGPAVDGALEDGEEATVLALSHEGSPGPSLEVRRLLLLAGAKLSAQTPADAVVLFERARALCAAEGLVMEEVATLMGLAGAYVAADAPELAVETYSKAAGLAEVSGAWAMACQAWLGVGGTYLVRQNHGPAAVAYRAAAAAAAKGGVAVLRIEALRLAGTCLVEAGCEDEAAITWQEALDVGAQLDPAARRASTLGEVQRALTALGATRA
jgi:hypothetical protein